MKSCTFCAKVLLNYVEACEHYQQSHGRNVLMCPYCNQYFMQATLLTKHVLAEHSKDKVGVEVVSIRNYSCPFRSLMLKLSIFIPIGP